MNKSQKEIKDERNGKNMKGWSRKSEIYVCWEKTASVPVVEITAQNPSNYDMQSALGSSWTGGWSKGKEKGGSVHHRFYGDIWIRRQNRAASETLFYFPRWFYDISTVGGLFNVEFCIG